MVVWLSDKIHPFATDDEIQLFWRYNDLSTAWMKCPQMVKMLMMTLCTDLHVPRFQRTVEPMHNFQVRLYLTWLNHVSISKSLGVRGQAGTRNSTSHVELTLNQHQPITSKGTVLVEKGCEWCDLNQWLNLQWFYECPLVILGRSEWCFYADCLYLFVLETGSPVSY